MSIPIFDVIGSPGSGKTSLVSHIIAARSLNSKPIISRSEIATKKPRLFFRQYRQLSIGLANKSPIFNKILLVDGGNVLDDSSNLHLDKSFSPFVDYSLGLIHSQDSSWLRKSLIAKWWVDTFLNRIKLEYSIDQELLCLDDEPLSYRLSLFSCSTDHSVIRKYYEMVPLPSGIIHIRVNEEDLLQRLKSRKRVAIRHIDLSDAALVADIAFSVKVANIASNVLEARGVPVLKLEGSERLETNAKRVIDFVQNFASSWSRRLTINR